MNQITIAFIVLVVIFTIAYILGCWLGIIYTRDKEENLIQDEMPLVNQLNNPPISNDYDDTIGK
uniref:Uncharacterized protein n=1 Tax=viral metagenome TaxID=1070528 RepID=A0A6H1ZY59_9ZZZZ